MGDVRGNLLLCLVGGTGTGKSISVGALEDLMFRAFPWDRKNGKGVQRVASPGSGEALIDAFHFEVDDGTGTGNKIVVPQRGLYVEAEFSAFVKRALRTGSTIKETVMSMYDSSRLVGGRSRSFGVSTAENHFMSLVSTTQPEAMSGLLGMTDAVSGFINRWVFVNGTPKRRPARSTVRPDTQTLVDPIRDVWRWSMKRRVLSFDHPAGTAYEEWYEEAIRPLIESKDPSPFAARLNLLSKKLLTLFAINGMREYINVDDVECAKAMWPSILEAYGIVAVSVGLSEQGDCSERILNYLRERQDSSFTVREIKKQSGARKYSNNDLLITNSISILVKAGEIEEVPRERGTAKAVRYRYVKDEPAHDAKILAFPTENP